jgi:hypothetical protein
MRPSAAGAVGDRPQEPEADFRDVLQFGIFAPGAVGFERREEETFVGLDESAKVVAPGQRRPRPEATQ